jgi:hypothetical protein
MTATTLSPIATRFAWKEYRTLRGFWLAALVIAGILQTVTIALAPPSADPVTTVFGIALAAAALYAVGVAATMFSMEHEEETYAYLTGLPTRWFPLFAGKCSFAATSSLLLAATLLTIAWLLSGTRATTAVMMSQLFSSFGFAIVEMLAWGMFFSLLIRQPLLAALSAIGAESLAVTWAASVFGERTTNSMSLDSYASVLGTRVAIAVCVVGIDVLLARRWLVHEYKGHAPETIAPDSRASAFPIFLRLIRAALARIAVLAKQYSPRVFSHLLWQAWRQSWKPMLSMTLIVPGLCLVVVLIAGIWNLSDRIHSRDVILFPYVIALVAMAIYWSVVFYADQCQNKYRFLAEHAVWPRYVWLSRLLVWSLPIVLLAVLATVGSITATFNFIAFMRGQFGDIVRHNPTWDTRHLADQWRGLDVTSRSIAFGLWGACLGFALGQATSLFFRRALVAAFAALMLSLPLAAWGFAAWTWELRPIVFLAPISLGLVAATWLRVSDWLTDRNSFAGWIKVLSAVVAPIVFIAWQLPAARTISQVEQFEALANLDGPIRVPDRRQFATALPFHADQVVSHWVRQSAAQITKEQQATVDRLLRLSEMIDFPPRPDAGQMQMEAYDCPPGYAEKLVAANQKIVEEAVPLVRTDYRLSVSDGGFGRIQGLISLLKEAGRLATRDGELDAALDYHLAALTLWERLWTGQSTNTSQSVQQRQQAQIGLVEWAGAEGQTSERIKLAITALEKIYPPVTDRQPTPDTVDSISFWTPPPQIIATHERLRSIILGKVPSRLLGKDSSFDNYVAVMSNELPLERARALTVLDFLTITDVARWRDVIWRVDQQMLLDWSKDKVLESGESASEDIGSSLRNKIQLAQSGNYFNRYNDSLRSDVPPYSWLRTSPFLRMELGKNRAFGDWLASVVNAEVTAWGLRQQLALLAYRVNHGKYPENLSDLVPEYLPFVPIDPYSGREFEYRPHGLELEIRFYADQNESIAAHTPLVWSIGAAGQTLDAMFVTEDSDPTDTSDDRRIRHEVYQFNRYSSWYDNPLVFPLPKLPADSSAEF